jgi:hypothetical protein
MAASITKSEYYQRMINKWTCIVSLFRFNFTLGVVAASPAFAFADPDPIADAFRVGWSTTINSSVRSWLLLELIAENCICL